MIDHAGINMEYGHQIASERIQSVNDNMAQSHFHEYFELYYLESGERFHMIGNEIYHMNSGEFVLIPPYIMHHSYGENDMPFKRLIVYFTKEMIMQSDILELLSQEARVYQKDEHREIHSLMCKILKEAETDDIHSKYMKTLLLNQISILLARYSSETAKPEQQNRITQIIQFLQENYTEDISLDDLSSHFYLSSYYLCHEFKKYTYTTIVQYINNLRVLHAQRLFQETSQSVTEISKIVGFSNVTHFNRIYKSVTGMSPSQTKKQFRERKDDLKKSIANKDSSIPPQ